MPVIANAPALRPFAGATSGQRAGMAGRFFGKDRPAMPARFRYFCGRLLPVGGQDAFAFRRPGTALS